MHYLSYASSLIAALAALSTTSASAQSLPITSRGIVSNVQGGLTSGPLAGASAGDVFVVRFSIQTPGLSGTQGQGSDSFLIVPGSTVVSVGAASDTAASASTFTLDVDNDIASGDRLATALNLSAGVGLMLSAADSTGGALVDANLAGITPTSLPGALFDAATFTMSDGFGGVVAGDLTVVVIGEAPTIHDTYCLSQSNSTGQNGLLEAFGSVSVSDNDVTLVASNLPANTFAMVIASRERGFSIFPGGSSGTLCLGGDIGRFQGPGQVQNTTAQGGFSLPLDLTSIPQPLGTVGVLQGETWNFQAWHRDTVTAPTSNFSSAIEITFP